MKPINSHIVLTASVVISSAFAQSNSAPWSEREHLLDFGGEFRTSLESSGIEPFLFYDSITAANVSGGLKHDGDFVGQAYGGLNFDLEKLFGWEGMTAKMSVVNRHGSTVNSAVGGIYDPMTIYGGQTTFLYDLWVEKSFGDSFSLKLGRLSSDQDFATSPLYGYSLSTAINGPIRALLLDGVGSTFPFPIWGGRAKFTPSEEHMFQVGIYQLHDRAFDASSHGTDFDISGDDGISLMIQYDRWFDLCGLEAHAFVGVNQTFGYDIVHLDGVGSSDEFTRFYSHLDVAVTEAFQVFGTFSYAWDDDVAFTPVQVSIGGNYLGLIPGRPFDRTVFFATYGGISEEVPYAGAGSRADHEVVYELGHRFQLNPATYIQPSIQYIDRPGGTGDIDDAVVLGAWVGLNF